MTTRRTVLAGAFGLMAAPAFAQTGPFDAAKLEAAVSTALAARSFGVLVLHGDRVAAERYAPTWGPERTADVASVGKSITAVLIGMAIDDGKIRGLDQPAADFLPEWRGTPKAAVTLRHLMSMTSGLEDKGIALRGVEGDQLAINAAAPLREPPGTVWRYNTAAYHLLFHILGRAVGEPYEAYAKRRLLEPLGMAHTSVLTSVGRGRAGPVTNYYSAISSTPDLGRFGRFAEQGGAWNGRRLVSAGYWRSMTTPSQALNPSYGLLWWLNGKPGVNAAGEAGLRFPGSPGDTIAALGAGGQAVMVVPSLDLVVVRQGQAPGSEAMLPELLAGVIKALRQT